MPVLPKWSPRSQIAASSKGGGLEALGGSWESWCEAGGANTKYGGRMDVCKVGEGFIVNPFAEPWTDVGVAERFTFLKIALPKPEEYDPENLITLSLLDPVRFGVLTTYANVVIPGIASGYMAQFIFPQAFALGFPIAVAKSLAVGGFDRLWFKILEPLVNYGGSVGEAALDYAFHGNAALVKYAVKKILPGATGLLRTWLLVISEAAFEVIDAVRDLQRLREQSTISRFGEILKKISLAADPGASRGLVVLMGEAAVTFAPAISALLKGQPSAEIFDLASAPIFGRRFSEWQGMTAAQRAAVPPPDQGKLNQLKATVPVMEGISGALAQIRFGDIGKAISESIADLVGLVNTITASAAGAPAPQAGTPQTGAPVVTSSSSSALTTGAPLTNREIALRSMTTGDASTTLTARSQITPLVLTRYTPPVVGQNRQMMVGAAAPFPTGKVLAALAAAAALGGGILLVRRRRRKQAGLGSTGKRVTRGRT